MVHRGKPLILELMTAGQISGYSKAATLLSSLPAAEWLLADMGCDAEWFREVLKDTGRRAGIQGSDIKRQSHPV